METEPEGFYRSFNATKSRREIIERLVLEFAGVELIITPTDRPGDFQEHVHLTFTSAEQGEEFMKKMIYLGQQDQSRRGKPSLR